MHYPIRHEREIALARQILEAAGCTGIALARQILEAAGYAVTAPRPRADYRDALSPVPEGYDTVLGYLAKHHPDALALFDYHDPEATLRDGYWLMHRSRGEEVWVPAPACLRARGIPRVRAYPVGLLAQRWG